MGRKKKESNIVNIGELAVENKIEIDYDKLAEAIVRAQLTQEETAAKKKAEELDAWQKSLGVNRHEDKKGLKKKR